MTKHILTRRQFLIASGAGAVALGAADRADVEEIIRPTGLLDPEIIVRGSASQIDDIRSVSGKDLEVGKEGDRVVVEGTDRLREGTRMNIVASDEKARAAATEEGDKSTAKPFGSDTPVQDSGKSE